MSAPTRRVAAVTHTGLVRAHNEDDYLATDSLVVVADGMGGHEAGEVASAAVIGAFTAVVKEEITYDAIRQALFAAQLDVGRISAGRTRAAGSTVAGIALVTHLNQPHWLIFHIGDSRVYRLLNGNLRQLTVDHSVVQELVDAGTLTGAEARVSRQRNVITRAVGAPDHDAEFALVPAVNSERFVVCSDGLSSEVDDGEIAFIASSIEDTEQCAKVLVQAALNHGGRDNVTVAVVDVLAGALDATTLDNPDLAGRFADLLEEEDLDDTAPSTTGLRRAGRE